MNTRFKIERRFLLTTSVLLAALWLPLTTFAQDNLENNQFKEDANSLSSDCARCANISDPAELRQCQQSRDRLAFWKVSDPRALQERVGFSETDPSVQSAQGDESPIQSLKREEQEADVGFAETDPAKFRINDSVATIQSLGGELQQNNAGFSETTPAFDTYQFAGKSPHQAFMDCLHGTTSDSVIESPEFSNLTVRGNQDEHG